MYVVLYKIVGESRIKRTDIFDSVTFEKVINLDIAKNKEILVAHLFDADLNKIMTYKKGDERPMLLDKNGNRSIFDDINL